MPVGYHHFYACSHLDIHKKRRYEYFIGGFVGDHINNEQFKAKLERVQELFNRKFGFRNYCYCWSPANQKPYKPRTQQQRFATTMKKTQNKHNRKIEQLKKQNPLFLNTFIEEENQKLYARQELLKSRYNQT